MISSEKRSTAKQYKHDKNYDEAELIYRELWHEKTKDWDKWLGWEYAAVLKSMHKTDDAIIVCKDVYRKYPDFKYNNDLLCWLLYEKYIKIITEDSTPQQIKAMVKIAEFIINTVFQDGKNTPFESTVFKVIDVLKSRNNINEKEILIWVDKLDYKLLSEKVITFNLQDGRNKEGASRKEEYFSIKTKFLEQTKKFDECIICCNVAFETISKFHYDNDIWIDVRRNFCIGMTSENETFDIAIQNLIILAERRKHWSIYCKIFDCYCRIGNSNKALIFGAKALLTNDPIGMKVTLLNNFSIELEKINMIDEATNHFALEAKVRKESNWKIHSDLYNKLLEYKIDDKYNVNIDDIKKLWLKLARSDEKLNKGKILSIMPHGRSGFISGDDGHNYFFKKDAIIFGQKLLCVGKGVSFRGIKSFDPKRQKESVEAVEIVIE